MNIKTVFNDNEYLSCCYGIIFYDSAKRKKFVETLKKEAEMELGKRIGSGMCEEQLREFHAINSKELCQQWLEENRPDYAELAEDVLQEVKAEIIRSLGLIQDAILNNDAIFRNTSVKELQLSDETKAYLKKNCILTIGEAIVFACHKDDSDIPKTIYTEILDSAKKYSEENYPDEKGNLTENIIREFNKTVYRSGSAL